MLSVWCICDFSLKNAIKTFCGLSLYIKHSVSLSDLFCVFKNVVLVCTAMSLRCFSLFCNLYPFHLWSSYMPVIVYVSVNLISLPPLFLMSVFCMSLGLGLASCWPIYYILLLYQKSAFDNNCYRYLDRSDAFL